MNNNQFGCGCNRYPYLPPMYPYMGQNYYACDCCNHMHQPTSKTQYPSNGPMQENGFMIINSNPYIIDTDNVSYGTKLSVSESIYTRISSRKDISCVNLAGTIDMTGDIVTNSAMNAFLVQTIENGYETLESLLDVEKSTVQFKLYFHVEDGQGGVVYETTTVSNVQKYQVHYTDVQDFYVTSFKQIFTHIIPSLQFQGVYNLVLDKIEAYMNVIKTKDHVVDDMNPFYQFTNNNTNIAIQHDTIQSTDPDGAIMIASTDLNWHTAFQANLTTRLKLSFTAFMSNMILSGNTFDIYNALYHPTERELDTLKQQVSILTGAVAELQLKVATLENTVANLHNTLEVYTKDTYLREGTLVYLDAGKLYQVPAPYTTSDDPELTEREAMEIDIQAGRLVPVTSE